MNLQNVFRTGEAMIAVDILYPFQQVRIQNFRYFVDKGLSDSVLVELVFLGVFVAIIAAASVGGSGDFFQRSGNKSDNEPSDGKSLNRYKTSTKYSHSLRPCRRALDSTVITIADLLAAPGLPKKSQFLRPTTNSRNVRSDTLLSMAKRPSVQKRRRAASLDNA